MTVAAGLHLSSTESIVNNSNTKFYPAHIKVPHHQLRQLISTCEADRIYYANKYDIYTLDLLHKQRALVATLPFEVRCLAARDGRICVGGDNGDCGFLKLERFNTSPELSHPKCFGHEVSVKQFGGEIVNSLTMHELSHGSHENASLTAEPVVLISNNDKTVKIYSLAQREVLATLNHKKAMNYALMSPDSEILAAVGDIDEAYFYRRHTVWDKNPSSQLWDPSSKWELIATPKIPLIDNRLDDHSFAIAFSPSGHLGAVSAQGGMIAVFDMEMLKHLEHGQPPESAIICSFASSRQEAVWGCVRSMAFSPQPWDLLAWIEDHGRMGVADMRQYFIRRQVLKLEKCGKNVEEVTVDDITPTEYKNLDVKDRLTRQHFARLNLVHGHVSSQPRSGLSSSEPRADDPRRRQDRSDSHAYHQDSNLSAREQSVEDYLQATMDEFHRSRVPYQLQLPFSLQYNPTPRLRASLEAQTEADEYIRSGYIQPLGSRDRFFTPRRRSSVVLSPTHPESESHPSALAPRELSRDRLTASPSHLPQTEAITPEDLPPLISTNDLTPQRGGSTSQQLPYTIPASDPWSTIQSALEAARADDREVPDPHGLDAQHPRTHESERDALLRLDQTMAESIRRLRHGPSSAETSALPTINVRPTEQTQQVLQSLRQHEDTRRHQMAHLENLERQVRRAESRVQLASSDIQNLQSALQRGGNGDRHARILEARTQSRRQAAVAAAARAEGRRNTGSELANRVSDNEMRMAILMTMARHSGQATDRNGNWVAGEALSRLIDDGEGLDANGLGGNRPGAIEDMVRERGLGTAGVGWSPDGARLYAGTEEGIFEFHLNIRDRMTFPSLELRYD